MPPTTASSFTPKKRKLAPFASLSQHSSEPAADFDHATYEAHQRESSSPLPQPSTSNPPSPEEDRASPLTNSRIGVLPPHLQDEVASTGGGAAGQSPSGAFAEITIDSGSSMSGSENGQDIHVKTDSETIAERSEIQRAASPAKRSAGEMEGSGREGNMREQPDSNEDVAMAGTSNDLYDQDTGVNSAATSVQGTMTTNTSATSFESEELPPYSAGTNDEQRKVNGGPSTLSIDDQVREVMQLMQKPLEHGDRGSVVSHRILEGVREDEIGPVDNSDIVPTNAFEEPILYDINGHPYIPLKQGLAYDEDYQVLSDEAWGLIVGWYGIASGQKQITRYAQNTAPDDAIAPNVVYEIYPPVFLVRKVPQPFEEDNKPADKARSAVLELRLKNERRQRGQMKADDALMVVSSRQERGHKFLTRVKEFAGIPLTHKVQIWRVLKPTNIAVNTPDNVQSGVASPPLSRDTSPSASLAERTKLVVDAADWKKMEIGKDIEQIDMTDQTANTNYNGSSTIEIFSLFENQTLILEEMTRGPGGGEYLSDQKKKLLAKKTNGSKPGSTVGSRAASPAPGSTVTTRGRSGGIMAKKYAEVLQGIYGENASSSFSPTNFKKTLSSQNPVFSGWGQQDSQEFLSYLVDSIHEDLNRIQKKPYLENPDSDDARVTDPEYIKNLVTSTGRTTLSAMNLVTFDPFASLTLQLPIESSVMHNFTFVPLNGTPKNHSLDLEKSLTVKDIK
ncbi:hypothetical protein E2P81_ATG10372, partial [Venturia nashicola]